MKRVRVYKEIISDENLRLAIREVNAGHRRNGNHSLNKKVIEIENNMDEYVEKLRAFIQGLVDGDEHMHPPLKRRRWDRNADSGKGKWRDINEPLLWPDQYVHHAVVQPMIPHIMRSMDRYCIRKRPRPRELLRRQGIEEVDEERCGGHEVLLRVRHLPLL